METLRTGLKKGEMFEDGGRIFVIKKVNEDGTYISKMLSEKALQNLKKQEEADNEPEEPAEGAEAEPEEK